MQQFVIETIAAFAYELATLRTVGLDEAYLLAAGLEERVRRYVHKVRAGWPKEYIDDDELRDEYIKLTVNGLQIPHDRWRSPVRRDPILRYARWLLRTLPQWHAELLEARGGHDRQG